MILNSYSRPLHDERDHTASSEMSKTGPELGGNEAAQLL